MYYNQLLGLFLLLIDIVTNFTIHFDHAVLYRIARTVEFELNITSAHFLANMDDPRFAKSRKRWPWNSFVEAVDSEDQFGGFKLVGKNSSLLHIAIILGQGSLNAGTVVAQVFHWFELVSCLESSCHGFISSLCQCSPLIRESAPPFSARKRPSLLNSVNI